MKLIDKVKTMDINEMAKFLTELQCAECHYNYDNDWKQCECISCWCHPKNDYETYKKMLDSEVEE